MNAVRQGYSAGSDKVWGALRGGRRRPQKPGAGRPLVPPGRRARTRQRLRQSCPRICGRERGEAGRNLSLFLGAAGPGQSIRYLRPASRAVQANSSRPDFERRGRADGSASRRLAEESSIQPGGVVLRQIVHRTFLHYDAGGFGVVGLELSTIMPRGACYTDKV